MHIISVRILSFLITVFVLSLLTNKTGADSIYSGHCIYPGGTFKIDLSGGFPKNNNYQVAVKNEHSRVEFYDALKENAPALIPNFAGRFPLSKLNYVKVTAISGSYLNLNFDIYDETGNLISTIDSGGICNLEWFREKHGNFGRFFREKEPVGIEEVPVSVNSQGKGKYTKTALFSLICFALGGIMGFRTPKMIEY